MKKGSAHWSGGEGFEGMKGEAGPGIRGASGYGRGELLHRFQNSMRKCVSEVLAKVHVDLA